MACKKSELVEAINTLISAVTTRNQKLLTFSSEELSALLDKIDFAPEEEETNDDQPEQVG